jgi:hypothetical protein
MAPAQPPMNGPGLDLGLEQIFDQLSENLFSQVKLVSPA